VGFWPGANAVNPESEIDLTHQVCGANPCPLEQFIAKANEYPELSKEVPSWPIFKII
jgi:hypothetical protein